MISKEITARPFPHLFNDACILVIKLRFASSVLCSFTNPNCISENHLMGSCFILSKIIRSKIFPSTGRREIGLMLFGGGGLLIVLTLKCLKASGKYLCFRQEVNILDNGFLM